MLPNLEGKVKPSEIVTSVVSDQLTSLLLLILINIFSSWDDTNWILQLPFLWMKRKLMVHINWIYFTLFVTKGNIKVMENA